MFNTFVKKNKLKWLVQGSRLIFATGNQVCYPLGSFICDSRQESVSQSTVIKQRLHVIFMQKDVSFWL